MATPRYNARLVKACLENAAGKDELAVLVVAEPGVQPEHTDIASRWCTKILDEALCGLPPDLSAFGGAALTDLTPKDDHRWAVFRRCLAGFDEYGAAGRWRVGPRIANASGPVPVTALQEVLDGEFPHLRLNETIRGVFWAHLQLGWIQFGWDLPARERDRASHTTILRGYVDGAPAAYVFYNATHAVIRAATPERLMSMLEKSIGVSPLKDRWRAHKNEVNPDEIRSALYVADKLGVHPVARGSYIADAVLPKRNKTEQELPLSALVKREDSSLPADVFTSADTPEDIVFAAIDQEESKALWQELVRKTPEHERPLLNALREDFLAGHALNYTETARRHGFDPTMVAAVIKRIRRRGIPN